MHVTRAAICASQRAPLSAKEEPGRVRGCLDPFLSQHDRAGRDPPGVSSRRDDQSRVRPSARVPGGEATHHAPAISPQLERVETGMQSGNQPPASDDLDRTSREARVDDLKALHLVRFVMPSHGKSVTRYRHVFDEAHGLDPSQIAVLSVLLLRGAQTPGELRAHIGRMAAFDSVAAVHEVLEALSERPEPLARLLSRRPGQKEERWQQLVAVEATEVGTAGSEEMEIRQQAIPTAPALVSSAPTSEDETDMSQQGADLERRVEMLQSELAALRAQVAELAASLSMLREGLGE